MRTIEKKKKAAKKQIKLLKKQDISEYQEWVNCQTVKLENSVKALVLTMDKRGVLRTGYWNCATSDIVFMVEATKHDILMEDYTNV